MRLIFLQLLLSLALKANGLWDIEPPIECWEECFHEGESQDKNAYGEFYQLGNFVKMHRIFNNVNGTAFILDTSVTSKNDVNRFRFQKDLIKLFAMMGPVGAFENPFYLGQFNQDFAWTCDTWHGLGRCEATNQLNDYVEMVDPKKLTTSMGKVHDACGILAKSRGEPTEEEAKVGMAVMVVSHSFGSLAGSADHHHSDLADCEESYPVRIGILTGNSDELEMSTVVSQFAKIQEDEYHATALARLTQCMQDSCCADKKAMPPNSCTKSTPAARKTERYSGRT